MAGGGGFTASAGDGGSNGGHPQGTEYTLQGEWFLEDATAGVGEEEGEELGLR